MALRIEDYALVGDCETAALVGRDGSVDWLCLPRFDSAACFAALLGTPDHGRWKVAPAGPVTAARRKYRGDTLVLDTTFETADGAVTVTDFMPVRGAGGTGGAAPDLVRVVRGDRGRVRMRSDMAIRFDYGAVVPWVRKADGGIHALGGPDGLRLWCPVPTRGEGPTTVAEFDVGPGDEVPFVLAWHRSYDPVPDPVDAGRALADTVGWWREWAGRCTYRGPDRDLVVRSLVTLKAMTYAPSGGIVAAPTTSLPEAVGGVRNWDYRYCWLRDATLTLLALTGAGYTEEAGAWRDWLLRAVAGDPAATQIMYGLGGERRLPEFRVPWLPGYEGSAPVRVGNAASGQFQLDVYGEVADALHQARAAGLAPADAGWALERALVGFVAGAWDRPDDGIWEVRGPRRHFTHSKVLAWVAVDRAIKSAARFHLDGPIAEWERVRGAIHARVCRDGFDAARGTFVQSFGSAAVDASLLMIPLVGFLPADDPRVKGTVAAVEKELMRGGFLLRYDTADVDDGLPAGEGAFLVCTLWLADCYALMGDREKARALFDRVAGVCNDVGLASEMYDPASKRLVGNFPQAFTHLGLVDTALALANPGRGPADRRKGG